MIKVSIRNGFDVGCHRFTVVVDSKDVLTRNRYGECSFGLSEIRFAPKTTDEKLHETILHEIIEAVNNIYCSDRIEHNEITTLANGLAQVLKSLGIILSVDEE